MTKDIFDIVAEEPDIFDRLDSDIFDRLGGDEQDVRTIVKKELSRMRPLERIIERPIIQQMPGQKVKEIVKEVRIEAPKDTKKYAEEKTAEDLKIQIETLKAELQNLREALPFLHGGPGVIGIPAPEGNDNKVLTVKSGKATWQTSTGGTSSDAYTPTNVTTTRSFNATSTSIDELANVLGSLIASLQGAGIVQ